MCYNTIAASRLVFPMTLLSLLRLTLSVLQGITISSYITYVASIISLNRYNSTVNYYFCYTSVFHLAISYMAQHQVAFCERHVALHVRHVALQVRHVALLIFRQWSASLNYCYVIFNPPRPLSQWKTPRSLMSRVHTYDAIPDNGLCT